MSGNLGERLARLYAGLVAFGASLALMVKADLGLGPWDVLHQAVAQRLQVAIGSVVIAVSVFVLLAWVPLRERPGFGTLSNAVVVGLVTNAAVDLLPEPGAVGLRLVLLIGGILLNAVATALYIGAGLGSGPRDGLMTGLARRGRSIRQVRTTIEAAVLFAGVVLGGVVGVGTVAYAVLIGPLAQHFLPRLSFATTTENQRIP